MKCSSGGRDIRENASYCSDCSKEVQGSGLNEQEMTQIWKELKDKRYEKIISYAFSTFFLFSGVVGVIKTSSSFPVWMVVASFIVSALLFISSARCGKRWDILKGPRKKNETGIISGGDSMATARCSDFSAMPSSYWLFSSSCARCRRLIQHYL